jgi:hypothetical protein
MSRANDVEIAIITEVLLSLEPCRRLPARPVYVGTVLSRAIHRTLRNAIHARNLATPCAGVAFSERAKVF